MTTAAVHPDQITTIPVDQIDPHPANRKRFDPSKLQELADSIASSGLLTPITVRPLGDRYQLVAGQRRWMAHQRLERSEILAIVRELTDEQAVEALVVENAQRENPHPLEEADGYAALMDVSGGRITVAELAARVGKSASYILQRLKLRELGPEGREAFWQDELTFSHALVVARLPHAKQAEALGMAFRPDYRDGAKENARVLAPFREFADRIREELHLPLKHAPFPTKDETLCPSAGSCAACPKRTGFSPELFPEIAKKDDECTDRSCYDDKVKAFVARQVEAARAKYGDALMLLTTGYKGSNPPSQGKPLCASYWSEAKKGDKGAVPAILVRDDFRGRSDELGKLLWVTVKKPVTAAGAKADQPPVEDWQAKRRAQESATDIEAVRRRRLFDAILPKVTRVTPQMRARMMVDMGIPDVAKEAAGLRAHSEKGLLDELVRSSEDRVAKVMVAQFLAEELSGWGGASGLLEIAKQLKLDAKKIMADPPAAKPAKKGGK